MTVIGAAMRQASAVKSQMRGLFQEAWQRLSLSKKTTKPKMNKDTVLKKATASVVAVEAKLNELDKLHLQAAKLADLIQTAHDSEAEILASSDEEATKVRNLLKTRAARDARSAGLNATNAEISAVEQEIITLGYRASLWLGSLRDGVTAAAKERVGAQVKAFFIPQAALELDRLMTYSLPVRAIDELDRLFFSGHNVPVSLDCARKLRPTLDTLEKLANSEPKLVEVIVGENWSDPVAAPSEQPVFADANALGSL
jgi:hypothetical protein